jgi:hypothetical protein
MEKSVEVGEYRVSIVVEKNRKGASVVDFFAPHI